MWFKALLSVTWLAVVASCAPISSLYFFGDSLTDTGNVLKATTKLNRYTFGLVDKQPTSPYATGRFSNGPVWAEQVADRLGHPGAAKPAGMSMGWFGQLGGNGNNYAVGGARTDDGGALGFLDTAIPTGMSTQVDFYLSRAGGIADPSGLYFFLGGGNDLRDAARLSDPNERTQAAQRAGANIAYSVRDLYLAGARQFVLINSPDVGLTPEMIGDGLSAPATHATEEYNAWFVLYGDYLRYSVPGFSLHYFDLFDFHHELLAKYGMEAVRPCKSQPWTCEDTLFFDSVHPTAWVHKQFGDRLADQILGVNSQQSYYSMAAVLQTPEPSTTVLTISALAFIAIIRKRRVRNQH